MLRLHYSRPEPGLKYDRGPNGQWRPLFTLGLVRYVYRTSHQAVTLCHGTTALYKWSDVIGPVPLIEASPIRPSTKLLRDCVTLWSSGANTVGLLGARTETRESPLG